ncbi:MAG: RagB/SusD family nutrient uptake outer membrane protein [Dysgonamonadaceae bacterium]
MRYLFYVILVIAFALQLASCTANFEQVNTNPYGVSDQDLLQDNLIVGGYFAQLQQYIYTIFPDLQVEQNLVGDAFAQYTVTPSPYMSNRNNLTYKFVWYSKRWENNYSYVMPAIYYFKENGLDTKFPNFYAWATILKIFAMHRVTDDYGPIIYSQYGTSRTSVGYDSQKDVYYSFFNELDTAIDTLQNYVGQDAGVFKKYDLAYNGNVIKWIQAANSLRLRLAVRIAKIDPVKARLEAEKAIKQTYGVIKSNDDNLMIALNSYPHPLWTFSNGWNECRMCATIGSILGGYSDPRLPIYFSPATDSLIIGKYIGERQGIDISSKSTYVNFARIGSMYENTDYIQIMTASEVALLKAEGALRGWDMGETAAYYYKQGIKFSFEQYALSDKYDIYINDSTSTFADYTDPKNPDNNFTGSSKIKIRWNEEATDEEKLEQIITQKWIALFPDGQEAWSEFRRTGYPKLIPVVVNYSGGTISSSEFVRRVPYPDDEYLTNPNGIAEGLQLLGGADNGGTRLWWDPGGANF